MSGNIKLSPKHGVNPSLIICFWCGRDIGVALLGRIDREDSEAPHKVVLDYEPCDTCKAERAQGFTFIEVGPTNQVEGMPPIGHDDQGVPLYPTGRLVVITMEAATKLVPPEALGGKNTVLVDTETIEALLPPTTEEGDTE